MAPDVDDPNNQSVQLRINRGHILALPAILMMPLAMLAPKGLVVLFVVTALAVLTWGCVFKKTLRWPPRFFWAPFAVFVAYAAMSSVWSPTPLVSFKSAVILGLITFGGLLLVSFAKNIETAERTVLARALIIGTVLTLVLFGVERFTDVSIWRWVRFLKTGVAIVPVPVNPMADYNTAMSVGSLYIWSALLFWSGGRRMFAVAGAFLAILIIFWSEAETPAIAVLLGVLTALLFWRGRSVMRVAFAGSVIALMVAAPLIPGLFPGPETIRSNMPFLSASAIQRIMIWKVAAKHIAEDPVAGLGMNTSRSLYGKETKFVLNLPPPESGGRAWTPNLEPIPLHPHNGIIQIWLELGGLGIAGLAWIIFTLVRITGGCLGQPLIFGFYVSSLATFSLSFGAWQSWWVCTLWLTAVLLVSQIPPAKLPQPDG